MELEQAGSSLEFRSFADALFAFLGLADKELSTLSFRCLVALVAHVSGEHHRHNTVAWYVHHLNTFDSGSASAPLHDTLCELLFAGSFEHLYTEELQYSQGIRQAVRQHHPTAFADV